MASPSIFGAVGDGVTDCTEAFRQAAELGVIDVGPGTWRVGPLDLSGARLVGAGRHQTSIMVAGDGGDGLTWQTDTGYLAGGGISDCHIRGENVRDLVTLTNVMDFDVERVRLERAGRHNLSMDYVLGITLDRLKSSHAGGAAVWVGATSSTSTTVRLRDCYLNYSGVGADVSGLGIRFDGCIFESNWGPGLVADGHVWVDGGYFENNQDDDLRAGTRGVTHLSMSGLMSYAGPYTQAGANAVLGPHIASAVLLGGDYSRRTHSIVIDPAARCVFASALYLGPKAPVMSDGSDVTAAPFGLILATEPSTGRFRTWGRFDPSVRYINDQPLIYRADGSVGWR